jgi:hypothetical protein
LTAEEISNDIFDIFSEGYKKIYDKYDVVRLTPVASSELYSYKRPDGVQNKELPVPTNQGTYYNWTPHQM